MLPYCLVFMHTRWHLLLVNFLIMPFDLKCFLKIISILVQLFEENEKIWMAMVFTVHGVKTLEVHLCIVHTVLY